jgi:hypothetical protein
VRLNTKSLLASRYSTPAPHRRAHSTNRSCRHALLAAVRQCRNCRKVRRSRSRMLRLLLLRWPRKTPRTTKKKPLRESTFFGTSQKVHLACLSHYLQVPRLGRHRQSLCLFPMSPHSRCLFRLSPVGCRVNGPIHEFDFNAERDQTSPSVSAVILRRETFRRDLFVRREPITRRLIRQTRHLPNIP